MGRTKELINWANDNHIRIDNGIEWECVQFYLAEQKNKQLTQKTNDHVKIKS